MKDIKIYNPLIKEYEDKSIERISKNVYLGILYKYLEKATIIQKKYDEVLRKTYNYAIRKKAIWAKSSFVDTSTEKLIKVSGFRLNSPMKEMNSFALDIRREYHIDIDITNVEDVLLKMISYAKLGLLHIPRITFLQNRKIYRNDNYGYYILRTFLKIPEKKEKQPLLNTSIIIGKEEAIKRIIKVKHQRKRIKQQENNKEDEFYYRGGIYKVPAFLQLYKLINNKELCLKKF